MHTLRHSHRSAICCGWFKLISYMHINRDQLFRNTIIFTYKWQAIRKVNRTSLPLDITEKMCILAPAYSPFCHCCAFCSLDQCVDEHTCSVFVCESVNIGLSRQDVKELPLHASNGAASAWQHCRCEEGKKKGGGGCSALGRAVHCSSGCERAWEEMRSLLHRGSFLPSHRNKQGWTLLAGIIRVTSARFNCWPRNNL